MIKLLGIGDEKKKPEEVKSTGKGFIPADRVRELSERGFSEPEMIDVLRKEGFSAEEIDRALTQALKVGVTGQPKEPTKLPTLQELQARAAPPTEETAPGTPQMPEPSMKYPTGYGTEEILESIVAERMGEVDERLHEFRIRYSELERSISNLHKQISDLTSGRTQTEQTIVTKIDAFKDSLEDMEGRLSSMEKAFKETLPALIESVRSLTGLVQSVKKERE